MTHASFSIYGMGTDHLLFIGWTGRSLTQEREILADLTEHGDDDVVRWLAQDFHDGDICLFEIDSANSPQDAKDTVLFWCQYYGMIGAKVHSAGL